MPSLSAASFELVARRTKGPFVSGCRHRCPEGRGITDNLKQCGPGPANKVDADQGNESGIRHRVRRPETRFGVARPALAVGERLDAEIYAALAKGRRMKSTMIFIRRCLEALEKKTIRPCSD